MMTRKILMGLTVLVAALAALAGASQAERGTAPHWLAHLRILRNEEHVSVLSIGAGQPITFDLGSGALLMCRVSFTDSIWNPLDESAGLDEMTAFTPFKCKQAGGPAVCPSKRIFVSAHGLPWQSHLSTEVPAGFSGNNVIERAELEVGCQGAKGPGIFKGALSLLDAGVCGAHCTAFEWGPQSSLSGESGTVTVIGKERVEGRAAGRDKLSIEVCNCNQRP